VTAGTGEYSRGSRTRPRPGHASAAPRRTPAGELCVGDLALALEVTEDQVSYALKMLRLAGLVGFRKDGRMSFYRLSGGFPHQMLEHCLRQLLTIASPEAGHAGA
jgi:DNA-binding transcriptional ArsR family regulator